MFEDIGTLLTNPDEFYRRRAGDPSLLEPAVIVSSIAVISALAGAVTILQFLEATPADLQIFLVIGGVVGLLFAAAGPFISWVLYALVFHAITYFFDGEGEFRDTFALAGWGFAPRVLGAVISLVVTVYVTQTVAAPAGPEALMTYTTDLQNVRLYQVASGVGILFILWSAYIWVAAVAHARSVSRGQAAIAVAIPVLVDVGLTVLGLVSGSIA